MERAAAGLQRRPGSLTPFQVDDPSLASPEHTRRMTVLVAEDQAELERTLRINPRVRLYEVMAARTGREALAMAASQPPPDAGILVTRLPDIDGIKQTGRLRRGH